MSTVSKSSKPHLSKRKAALAALEDDDASTGATIQLIDDGDEEEEEKETSKAERKKHKKEPKLAAAAAAPAASASTTVAEEGDSEMAKPLAPVVAAASSSSSQAMVPMAAGAMVPAEKCKFTKLNPFIDTQIENDGEVDAVTKIKAAYEICKPLVRQGACRVKNPDLALALWCYAANMRISYLDVEETMNKKPHLIQVARTYEKIRDAKGKFVDDTSKPHVNPRLKGEQFFMPDHVHNLYGLSMLSPFCSTRFFKHGPTVESGVEGTNGKVIEGTATPPLQAQYQVTLTNKPVMPHIVDEDFNNPIAGHFLDVHKRLTRTVMAKALENSENMVEVRKIAAKQFKDKTIPALPSTGEEWVDWMMKNGKFKSLERTDEEDDTLRGLQCSVPVFRRPIQRKENGRVVWSELDEDKDLTDEEKEAKRYPSELFKTHRENKHGMPHIHNDIPTFRGRRADELEEGKTYPCPLIFVGMSQNYITPKHKIAVVYKVDMYEWKLDKAGVTCKQMAYIVLGTDEQLKRIDLETVVAVDPRFAIPMAQPFGHDPTKDTSTGSTDAAGNWSAMPADPDKLASTSAAAAGFASN